mmetsp:Transcript_31834/g.89187  ORF Transcript_31834/g.89187 Transcript_31834/m.89187 type:complete len:397 (-) Transcript_31834:61-1251(-)
MAQQQPQHHAAGPRAAQPAVGDLAFLPTSTSQVKNARALLRYALPLDNKPMRSVQFQLESISEALRVPGVKFSDVKKAVNRSKGTLQRERAKILEPVPEVRRAYVEGLLGDLQQGLDEFDAIIDNKDRQVVPLQQQKLLGLVGLVEEAQVKDADGRWVVPFDVPREYGAMPQLRGRATLEMKVTIKDPRSRGLDYDAADMTLVLDGLNAPVTAGNFLDLVQRKFYDGMEVQRADGLVVQTGDPPGAAEGFVGADGEVRRIPFEVRVKGDREPIYEETMEDVGRANEVPALPFNAYGTMAMAREEFEANSASSQVFWLLKDSEITPTGSNLLDGRYAVFGYITDGADALGDMQVGDVIDYIKCVEGLENLASPTSSKAAAQAPPPAGGPVGELSPAE